MPAVRPLAVFAIGGVLCLWHATVPSVAVATQPKQQETRVDRYGDALPAGAVARLGTVRLREGKEIYSIAYSKDGKILASAGQDGVVRLWDAEMGKELHRFEGHEHHVFAVALSPDNRWMASGADQVIRLWDLSTGKVVRKLGMNMGGIFQLNFSPDSKTLLSSTGDRTVRLWNIATGEELHRFGGELAAEAVAFTPAGDYVIAGKFDVRIWDVKTGKQTQKLDLQGDAVHSLAFTTDGSLLAVGSGKIIYLFDMATGKALRQLTGHTRGVSGIAFGVDGKTLVSTGHDDTIRLWDVGTGKEKHQIQERVGSDKVVMAPDGKTFASAGPFNYIRLWDTATGKERVPAEGHQGIVRTLAFLELGKKIVTAGDDGTVRLWDVQATKEVRRLLDSPREIEAVVASPDGQWIAAGGYYWQVHLFATATGKCVHVLKDTTGGALAFSPDSRRLACGGPDAAVELRDVVTGRKLESLKGHKHGVHALAFSPDGMLLVSSTLLDRTILFWDSAKGKQVRKINSDLGALCSLVFSLDGQWLIAQGRDNNISLWEVTTGKEVPRFNGIHGYMVHALSPDSRTLAVAAFGGNAREIRLYEMTTGKERHRFQGHLSGVRALAFSPDNGVLATAGEDTAVLLWDLTGAVTMGLPPKTQLAAKELDHLWEDLAGQNAVKAYRAVLALANVPDQAVPILRARLKPAAIADKKTDGLSLTPAQVRDVRALEVLERVGNTEAHKALAALAQGAAEAWLTRKVRAALQRMEKRSTAREK